MKLWIDDVRPAPEGYVWCKSVNEAIEFFKRRDKAVRRLERYAYDIFPEDKEFLDIAMDYEIELIDIDYDAGDYVSDGGDYIKLLDWLEATGRNYPIRIHSANPVGVQNMRRIIKRNRWKEVF